MASAPPGELLRTGLLDGSAVLLAGARDARGSQLVGLAATIAAALRDLGAVVSECLPLAARVPPGLGEDDMDGVVASALERCGAIDAIVLDGAALFASGEGRDALRTCLDGTWAVVRSAATAAFIAPGRPGRVVLLAPSPAAGRYAEAACAGLENLARTLSVEWARYGLTVVTVALGDVTGPHQVAALVGYLLSPAGAYFSGCLLDLRGPRSAA